ncbi:tropomodulin [Ditylenchus destructor]|uniref:Tropomodulin n=1 Tax=Ditylenchus destructor TaxID=166010 RepID=A0AAD4N8N2_9BILA|nr:tropomodulin [Ditylenchus destructor]
MADDEAVEVMTDADFERALDALREEGSEEVGDLLKVMNENRIISWEEAERILGETNNEPVKSSLPAQTRPTEPDNDTDVDQSIQRLLRNDPKLVEINLNNMKRTPIPQVKRLIMALQDNTYLEKLSLANMGLYDMDIAPLIDVMENNDTLRAINVETNYLSGDFFAKLFRAALRYQSLEEVKAVNQGVSFSTTAEREIIDAIFENRGLTKISLNLRLPEGRHKVEKATIRNQEIRRILRRQAAAAAAAERAKNGPPAKPAKKPSENDVPTTSKKTISRPATKDDPEEAPRFLAKPAGSPTKPKKFEDPEEEIIYLKRPLAKPSPKIAQLAKAAQESSTSSKYWPDVLSSPTKKENPFIPKTPTENDKPQETPVSKPVNAPSSLTKSTIDGKPSSPPKTKKIIKKKKVTTIEEPADSKEKSAVSTEDTARLRLVFDRQKENKTKAAVAVAPEEAPKFLVKAPESPTKLKKMNEPEEERDLSSKTKKLGLDKNPSTTEVPAKKEKAVEPSDGRDTPRPVTAPEENYALKSNRFLKKDKSLAADATEKSEKPSNAPQPNKLAEKKATEKEANGPVRTGKSAVTTEKAQTNHLISKEKASTISDTTAEKSTESASDMQKEDASKSAINSETNSPPKTKKIIKKKKIVKKLKPKEPESAAGSTGETLNGDSNKSTPAKLDKLTSNESAGNPTEKTETSEITDIATLPNTVPPNPATKPNALPVTGSTPKHESTTEVDTGLYRSRPESALTTRTQSIDEPSSLYALRRKYPNLASIGRSPTTK